MSCAPKSPRRWSRRLRPRADGLSPWRRTSPTRPRSRRWSLAPKRRFALELAQHGITVNAVAAGFVRTDMTQRGRGAADWPGTEERSPDPVPSSVNLRHRQCRGVPGFIGVRLDYGAGADGGRWADGLHWTRLDRALRR